MKFSDVSSRFASVSRAARALITSDQKSSERKVSPTPRRAIERRERSSSQAPVPPRSPAATSTAVPPSATTSERKRTVAVFASEHSQGRERQAADMLGTRMTAHEIIGCLAKAPRVTVRNTMLERMAADRNPDLGAGNADAPIASGRADRTWTQLWSARQA